MNIAAVTSYKHGLLYKLLSNAKMTQTELARRINKSVTRICNIVCLKFRPNDEEIVAIAEVFKEDPLVVQLPDAWNDWHSSLAVGKTVQIAEIDVARFIALRSANNIPALQYDEEREDLLKKVEEEIALLPPRSQKILGAIFYEGKTLDQVSKENNVSTETVRTRRNRALDEVYRKLRARAHADERNGSE